MDSPRMLFLRIGWMTHYCGATRNDPLLWHDVDPIETQNWWETRNFLPASGRVYGSPFIGKKQIHIERFGVSPTADRIDGVVVVWVAPREGVGHTAVVGWYKHATVFRNRQPKPRGHCVTAKEKDCVCLPVDYRNLEVPSAKAHQKGRGMGQALVWYPGAGADAFKRKLLRFVKDWETGRLQRARREEIERTLAEDEFYRESPARRLRIIPKHNRLSNSFKKWLGSRGILHVTQESSRIDVTFRTDRGTYLAELKVCDGIDARRGIREALGQLLEYNLYPGRTEADNWMVVLDVRPSTDDLEFWKRVSKRIRTRLYLAWRCGDGFKLEGPSTKL